MRFVRENGLSLALLGLFLVSLAGQAFAGWHAYSEELTEHGQAGIGLLPYLGSGHFWSALFENWESEFLQLFTYVLLTVFLRQKGSPESKPLEGEQEEDEDPWPARNRPGVPAVVRRGGLLLKLYSNSLSLAMAAIFVVSFLGHLVASTARMSSEEAMHGRPARQISDTLADPEFWYESFQNWQSEFFSIAALVVLGIYLRQKGSPESKPVAAPHDQTGR